jgi:tetratricopeptide (TPR) repeat protein
MSDLMKSLILSFLLIIAGTLGMLKPAFAQRQPVDTAPQEMQPQVRGQVPNQEQRLAQLARRYEEMADFEHALAIYQDLAARQPNNFVYYQGVLRNALYLKNYDLALSWVQKYLPRGVGRNPADPLSSFCLEVDRGEVIYRMEQPDSAFAIWHRALQDVGYDPNAYAKIIRTMLQNRLMDEAIDVIKQAREKGADPAFMATDLATIMRSRMDYAGATREFLKAYQSAPGRFGLIQREFSRFPTIGDVVDSVVLAFEPYLPEKGNQDVRSLLVGFLMKSQRYDEALVQVRTLDSLSEKPGQPAFDFAQQFLQDGKISHARVLFQDVVDRDKADNRLKTAARLGLARCLDAEGKSAEALTQYEELASLGLMRPEGREARFRAGVVRLRDLKDFDGAKKDFQKLLSAGIGQIGDQEVGLWLGDCFVMQGDLTLAKNAYLQAVSRPRNNRAPVPAILRMRLARLALWSEDYQSAADMLDLVSKGDLDDDTVNDALVWSLFLSSARQDSVALGVFAKGDLLSFQGNHEQATAKFQEARNIAKKDRVGEESLIRLAMELRSAGQARTAVDSLMEFLVLFPSSVQREDVQFMIGDILERDLGDIPAAIEHYEQMLIDYPGGMHMEEVRRRVRQLETYKQS